VILITGGLGYLGVRISEHLLSLGYNVRLGTSRINVVLPQTLKSCECVKFDFQDSVSLEKACSGVTVIIHLAALDAVSSLGDPSSAVLVNGLGTLKLLQAAEKSHVKQFLYMSTVHVYGSPLRGFLDETSLPRPVHHYSITHRLAEDYVLEASKRGCINGVVFRLSNAVGSPAISKGHSWSLIVNDLCKQVLMNGNMRLSSGEGVLRDYLPISSVVTVVANFIENTTSEGGVYNLSSGISLSLRNVSELISQRAEIILKLKPKIYFNDIWPGTSNIENLLISNAKLKNIGIEINSDISAEIDQILLNCREWF
jgi:UDP-glucose 4-epimerase